MRLSFSGTLRRGVLVAGLGLVLATAVAAGPGRFVRVKVDEANIRLGPGTRYELLWAVEKNFPLKVLERRKQWLKTEDFLGDEGWIYAPLTDTKAAVVVETDFANVRGGPSTKHPVSFQAEWGTGLRVLGRKASWLRVEEPDGRRGWIHEDLVWGPVP